VNNVINPAAKRNENALGILSAMAILELYRRDCGLYPESDYEFQGWLKNILPKMGYELPVDPSDVFDREQLAALMDLVK